MSLYPKNSAAPCNGNTVQQVESNSSFSDKKEVLSPVKSQVLAGFTLSDQFEDIDPGSLGRIKIYRRDPFAKFVPPKGVRTIIEGCSSPYASTVAEMQHLYDGFIQTLTLVDGSWKNKNRVWDVLDSLDNIAHVRHVGVHSSIYASEAPLSTAMVLGEMDDFLIVEQDVALQKHAMEHVLNYQQVVVNWEDLDDVCLPQANDRDCDDKGKESNTPMVAQGVSQSTTVEDTDDDDDYSSSASSSSSSPSTSSFYDTTDGVKELNALPVHQFNGRTIVQDFEESQTFKDLQGDDDEENTGVLASVSAAFRRVFSWVSNGCKVFYRDVKEFLFNDIIGAFKTFACGVQIKRFVENNMHVLCKLITSAFRCMWRIITGMPNQHLIAETMFDVTEILAQVFGVTQQEVEEQAEPQDAQPAWYLPLSAVFATLLAIFSAQSVNPTRFSYIWRSATSIASYIQACARGITGFSHLVFGYTPEKAFPRTLAFNDWLLAHLDKGTLKSHARRVGARLYLGFLLERMEWSKLNMTDYFQVKCPMIFRDHSSLTACFPKFRMQPPCFAFEGTPGHGKTHIMNQCLNALYKMCRAFNLIDGDLPYGDFSYSWSTGKKHMDGYTNQPATVINDFGKENETSSDADAASTMFMNMVDSNPYYPSFASLQDKGICFDAIFMMLSTMIPTCLWKNHFKKCADVNAMIRRITRSWKIVARSWDSDKKQMKVDPAFEVDDQWIITDSETGRPVSIHEVVEMMFEDILSATEKYENTFDAKGMMKIPTMDNTLDQFIRNNRKYRHRLVDKLPDIEKINKDCFANDLAPDPKPQITWWESGEMKIGKMMLRLDSSGFKFSILLKSLIGFGVGLGFMMAYLHKDGLLQMLSSGVDKTQEAFQAGRVHVEEAYEAGRVHVQNAANYVVDKVSPASPNAVIGGKPYYHAKAKINDNWVNAFLEETVQPQSKEVLLQKLIPSQYRKRMLGRDFPDFRVVDAHVSCLNEQGEHAVWGVVLDTQHLLVAKHYFDVRDQFVFVTNRSRLQYVVDKKHVRSHAMPDLDQVLVRLFDVTICNGRNIHKKFPIDTSILPAQSLNRMSTNGSEVARVRSVCMTKSYGHVSNITCTSMGIGGKAGDCGSLYIDHRGMILGIHVAGSETRSFMVTVSSARLSHAMQEMSDVSPPNNIYGDMMPQSSESDSAKLMVDLGVAIAADGVGPYAAINRRSDLMKIPISVDLPDEYDVAPLGFHYREDVREPIEKYRLGIWAQRNREKLKTNLTVRDDIIAQMSAKVDFVTSDELIPWDKLGENYKGVPSITRKSSAGPWFSGQNKGIFCTDREEPELNSTTIEILEQMDDYLQRGASIPIISGTSLKVERLPSEKCEQGKTRVFQAGDGLAYLLDRHYFGSIIAEMSGKLKAQTGVCYAATPEEVGAKVAAMQDLLIASDVEKQDISHQITAVILMKFFLKTKLVSNENPEFSVHPQLPLLTRDNRARFIRMRDTGFGQRVYHSFLVDNVSGGLASGALLTTIFNCIATWYSVELACFLAGTDFPYVLFGDDVLGEGMADFLIEAFGSIGFKIKGVGSDGDFMQENKAVAVFCGRHFSSRHKRMNLTRDRLGKIIRFVTTNNTETAYIASFSNFMSELAYEDDYLEVLQSVKFAGVAVSEFLAPELLDPIKVRAEGFWSSRSCVEDDLTVFEDFSNSIIVWLERSNLLDYVEKKLDPMLPQMDMDKGKEAESPHTEIPASGTPDDITDQEMVSVITTDAQDISRIHGSEKEKNFSFSADEINQFWSRPVRISTATWSTGQAQGVIVTQFTGFTDIIDAATNYQLKLANTVGIHGVMRVFCIINATPFQAGGLVLAASPNARDFQSVFQKMSGPHAVITAGANQTATLDIPYNRELLFAPTQAYSSGVDEIYFDWVRVCLMVLSPLSVASGASVNVNAQLLVQLVDMDVMQGSVTNFTFSAQANQVGIDRAASSSGAVVKGISGIAESVSKIAAAGMSMLSKASHTVSSEPTGISVAHSIASYNGTDDSKTAALNASARTIVHPGLHNDSVGSPTLIKNIAARSGLMGEVTYTTLTAVDELLGTWYAHPLHASGSMGVNNLKTPATYLAAHFGYWRGTMTFRFTIFKTAFHSGTLELLVDYGGDLVTPNTSARSINLHRVYWDITSQSTITVSIPYRRPWHWCQFGNLEYNPVLYLVAVQPLIAGSNVVNSVDIIVESWSPDLQVAWPQRCLTMGAEVTRPVVTSATEPPPLPKQGESSKVAKEEKSETFRPSSRIRHHPVHPQMYGAFSKVIGNDPKQQQGNFDPAVTTHELADHVVLGTHLPKPDTNDFAYRYIAGEEVIDLVQVLKRFHPLNRESSTSIPANFVYRQDLSTLIGGAISVGAWPLYIESLSKLFVYGTGGYRLKATPRVDQEYGSARVFIPTEIAGDFNSNLSPGTPAFFQNSLTKPCLEIEVPNVSQFFYYRLETGASGSQLGNRPPLVTHIAFESSDVGDTTALWFAMSDDVSWGGQNYLQGSVITVPDVVYTPSLLE